MPCYSKYDENGTIFLRGDLGPKCNEDGCNWVAEFLCDYPVGDEKTCDRHLCNDHAIEIAPNVHYCSAHHDEWVKFRDSGGVKKVLENVIPFGRG